MICPACGKKNRDGARFCRSCGRPIDEPDRDVPARADVPAKDTPGADVEPPGEQVEGEPRAEPAPEPGEDEGSVEKPAPEAEQQSAVEQEPAAAQEAAAEATDPGASAPEPPAEIGLPGEVAPEIESEIDQLAPAAPDAVAPGEGAEASVEPASDAVADAEAVQDDDLSTFWREDKEPIEPLTPGTLVDGRYLVLEVLDAGEDEILYRARDLLRCWQCGAEIEAGEAFCPQCGAAQQQASQSGPEARLLEVRPPGETASTEMNVLARLTHEGRPILVIAESQARPEPPAAPPAPEGIRLIVGQRSHPGQVRELDEDSILAMQVTPTYEAVTSLVGLFAVADGMGGHEGGEIASKLALQVLADHTLRTIVLPELKGELLLDDEVLARLRRAVLEANDAVYLARQKRGNDMGTTLTTVLVRDRRMLLAHVGDCRAYRWSDAGLEQLTTDHSVVASMIAHGQVAPEEIYTHPHRSVIYRAVGDQPTVEVDGDLLPLEPGDRIVICSDGLWEMVRTEGIADVMMQEANPQVACDLLVRLANAAGGEDNISVIVVQVEAA